MKQTSLKHASSRQPPAAQQIAEVAWPPSPLLKVVRHDASASIEPRMDSPLDVTTAAPSLTRFAWLQSIRPDVLQLSAHWVSAARLARWRGTAQRMALALVLPLALLALWQWVASHGLVPAQILPAPAVVWATLVDLAASGELASHTAISLHRVLLGVLLGGSIGLGLGLAMGLSRHFDQFVGPTVRVLASVPKPGWLPLLVLLLGIDEALKVVAIAIGAAIPLVIHTYEGVRSVPRRYLEVASVHHLPQWRVLRRVILPAAVPSMVTGFVLAFSFSWKALVLVELMASSEGLGFLMTWGRQLFQLDIVMAAIVVIGVVGGTMDWLLSRLAAHLLRWRGAS